VLYGDFKERNVSKADRQLKDIAFSGNGEPTSAKEFPQGVLLVEKVLRDFGLLGALKIRLITNGSLMDKRPILDSSSHLAKCNGEVWFKVDAATKAGIARINDVRLNPQSVIQRLRNCAKACPTYVQTCMFALDGAPPNEAEIVAYLALLDQVTSDLQGVHLYGLARPSMRAEAERLSRLPPGWLEAMAQRIRQHGLTVHVSP
jgi:wyosine [tRNA(Phe)-imidazoG37] synthetase (radical SAM superfamily)